MQPHQLVAMHVKTVDLSTVSKGNDVVRKDDVENSQKAAQSQSSQETSKKEEPKNLQVHLINL